MSLLKSSRSAKGVQLVNKNKTVPPKIMLDPQAKLESAQNGCPEIYSGWWRGWGLYKIILLFREAKVYYDVTYNST